MPVKGCVLCEWIIAQQAAVPSDASVDNRMDAQRCVAVKSFRTSVAVDHRDEEKVYNIQLCL